MNAPVSPIRKNKKNAVAQQPALSFEFFPAKSAKMERNLWRTMGQLELFNPSFFSMTYGALGSERDFSINMVDTMCQEGRVPVAAHITAAGHSRDELLGLAQQFYQSGAKHLVALRGDAELVADGITDVADMVSSLLEVADFDISVAAYPEVHPKAASLQADLENLKRKLDAGAKRAITQYFFDADVFLRFRDQAEKVGIHQPLVPGILPVHNFERVKDFSVRCGANVPAFMDDLFAGTEAGSDQQREIGIEHATRLSERLLAEGVDALHFYTLNLPNLTYQVVDNLGLADSQIARAA